MPFTRAPNCATGPRKKRRSSLPTILSPAPPGDQRTIALQFLSIRYRLLANSYIILRRVNIEKRALIVDANVDDILPILTDDRIRTCIKTRVTQHTEERAIKDYRMPMTTLSHGPNHRRMRAAIGVKQRLDGVWRQEGHIHQRYEHATDPRMVDSTKADE